MEVIPYEPWMEDQVVQLFVDEYGGEFSELKQQLHVQYNHPFQKDRAFRLAAIDRDEVLGFTSFLYWPLKSSNGRTYNSFQCGNVVVGKKHRGKGVFSSILRGLNSLSHEFDYDFIIGFPVQASFPGFMKYGWDNPFNLEWHTKLSNPLAPTCNFGTKPQSALVTQNNSKFLNSSTHLDEDFSDYRHKLMTGLYLQGNVTLGDDEIQFEIKYQQRKKVLIEGIIGRISKKSGRPISKDDVSAVLRASNTHQRVSFFSFAQPQTNDNKWLHDAGFKKLEGRSIHFIVKNGRLRFQDHFPQIELGRGDIDTW